MNGISNNKLTEFYHCNKINVYKTRAGALLKKCSVMISKTI